ncbi:MAG TPA: hypothetical protein VFV34_13250 [Blastocatellia bacterium]|nr:hypothetical protein [Blastocatellia bacterium]
MKGLIRRPAIAVVLTSVLVASFSTFAQSGGAATQATHRYIVRPVGMGSNISVRARSTRQIQVQVTDENDRPVPDIPIIFAIAGATGNLGSFAPSGAGLGSGAASGSASASGGAGGASGAGGSAASGAGSFSVTTDAGGMARAEFVAGDTPGNGTLTARVDGTDSLWSAELKVKKAHGFWTTRNTLLVLGGIAAGTAVAVATTRGGGNDRTPQPNNPKNPGTTRPQSRK